MIVEFLGPTSSGKSTLVAAFGTRLHGDGIEVRTAEEIALGRLAHAFAGRRVARAVAVQALTIPWLASGIVRWPRLPGLLFRLVVRHGETTAYRLHCARNALLHIALESRARSAASRQGCVVLLDEGLVSFVDLLAESARPPLAEAVEAYAAAIPVPDLVVYVATEHAVRVPRLLARGHRRLHSGDRAAVEAYARHGEHAARLITGAPQVAARLVTVDPGADREALAVAVEAVRDAILERRGREGAAGARGGA